MRGYVFEKFAEPNPLGTWMKMTAGELGLKQDYLNEIIGASAPNAVTMMFMPDRQGPSFATPAGGILIDAIAEEERAQWKSLWGKHAWGKLKPTGTDADFVRYPPSRWRILRQAAFALSLWNVPGNDLRERNREFFELLPMLHNDVYAQMICMLCEPYHGMILGPSGRMPRKPVAAGYRQQSQQWPLRMLRKSFVAEIVQAEGDSCRDEIFDHEFDMLVVAEKRHLAFERVLQRLEGLQNQREERDRALMEVE